MKNMRISRWVQYFTVMHGRNEQYFKDMHHVKLAAVDSDKNLCPEIERSTDVPSNLQTHGDLVAEAQWPGPPLYNYPRSLSSPSCGARATPAGMPRSL